MQHIMIGGMRQSKLFAEEKMKSLFTVHAGEYFVGSHIETHYPKWNVWVPSKDTGIDLLVTNAGNTKDRDFTPFLDGWREIERRMK